jgi:hypothetical protein
MTDPPPVSSPVTSDEPAEVRLDSWKEIATYVKRDISTVQRWEKREGMPIHRHVHDKRGSVYALSSELDAWLLVRRQRLEEEEKGRGAEAPVDAEGDHEPKHSPWARRWLALGGAVLLALLAVTYLLTRSRVRDAAQPKIKSLAVLPLRNLSGDATQEYLADGMTEALGARSSLHFWDEGVLIHPPHQGDCGRHGTEEQRVTSGELTESPGDTGVSGPISVSEVASDALSVVGLPNST